MKLLEKASGEVDPTKLAEEMDTGSNGFELPGLEPERLKTLKTLFEQY